MGEPKAREKNAESAEQRGPDASLIGRSPSTQVGDSTFTTVPGPVGAIGVLTLARRHDRRE